MSRKFIICLFLSTLLGGYVMADEGFTIWQLTERRFEADSAIIGRIGMQMGFIEPFVGTSWIPKQNGETGNIDPPQMINLGTIIHFPDLIDPNSPLPWIDDALLIFLSEEWKATPYIGWQGTWNFADDDAGYNGGMTGLLIKAREDDPDDKVSVTFAVEGSYNNFFGQAEPLRNDDEWVLSIGVRIFFK